MPIYEFECLKCKTVTERIEKLGTEQIVCPKCKAKARKRPSIPSRPVFIGAGFYETDYQKLA